MNTTTRITVHADTDYQFEVQVSMDAVQLVYREKFDEHERKEIISFGYLAEMEAVAKAMLQAVEIGRENGCI